MPVKPIDLPSFFPYQLSILQKQVSNVVGIYYRQQHGLTRNGWRAMAALALYGRMSAKEIGDYVQLDKMPVSRAVQELKNRQWVQQSIDTEDRRINSLELTHAGQRCYDDIVPHILKGQEQVLEVLSDNERRQLERITRKLLKHTQPQTEP